MAADDFYMLCRSINGWLAIGAAFGVCFRLASLVLDKQRWIDPVARHRLLWFIYIAVGLFVVSRGSAHYDHINAPASSWSVARLGLTVAAIALTIWWPHPSRLVPLEEEPDAA